MTAQSDPAPGVGDLADLRSRLRIAHAGDALYGLVERMYPICRSITGDGVRETLSIVKEQVPLEVHEVASGTPVLDWTVPKEWNIRDAWVKDATGRRVVDLSLIHISEPTRLLSISYAVFCLKKKIFFF